MGGGGWTSRCMCECVSFWLLPLVFSGCPPACLALADCDCTEMAARTVAPAAGSPAGVGTGQTLPGPAETGGLGGSGSLWCRCGELSVGMWRRSERRAVARSKPEASKKAPPVLSCPSWYSRALQISRQLCRTAVPLSFLILRVAPPSLFPTRSLSSRRLRAQKSTESHMQ